MGVTAGIDIEVAYARPDRQEILSLTVPEGTTALEAARRSGIVDRFPEIDLDQSDMGIFSRVLKDPAAEVLRAGDRVEIYRPLNIDPKQARLNRARGGAPLSRRQ
ncbi:RnfH family protein [Marinobacter sp. C2H3]|uniref:RnfH family protein n=1 Tax=Marinobacter sp. C2H3 TaxID=3119003 RepID=UPI00300F1B9B